MLLRFSRGKGFIDQCLTYLLLLLLSLSLIVLCFADYDYDYDIYHWVRNKSIWKKLKLQIEKTRPGDFDASLDASFVSTPGYQTKFKINYGGEQLKPFCRV